MVNVRQELILWACEKECTFSVVVGYITHTHIYVNIIIIFKAKGETSPNLRILINVY